MKKIYFLVLIPISFIIGTPIFANKVTPYILGMPFFMFFVCLSMILTSLTLLTINKFTVETKGEDSK
ncbi:uncharacterized protein DUF3311 [Scopulibacillus darangshiensis]|uniref:Uncharacterized protein DUF3311 n=1 Tax=Scopulibacillus darangshiensis TaxID=442528 RepID=A0A4R2NQ00_9BACL|nr:DUF3311 domain-containing protein [Scopulibacillus darangshiensis]TCP23752.1 uncharacterized protein DUF3311 [Scopulibacillus darangshiensis]